MNVAMNKKPIIPIFFAVDDNYAPNLHVTVESIISQASKDYQYHIVILSENLSDRYRRSFIARSNANFKVMVKDMTRLCAKRGTGFHTRDYYSKTTYFRIFIPELFPQYTKVIYLDSDVVLNADISELYNHDISGMYAAAATCETCHTTRRAFYDYVEKYLGLEFPWYFNAGVLLLNIELLRRENFEARFFDILSKIKFEVIQDQDYLNVLFRGRVLLLPQIWNKIARKRDGYDGSNVKLIHYNLYYRPWRYDVDELPPDDRTLDFEDIFWKHAKNSPAYGELLEIKKNYGADKKLYDATWMTNLEKNAQRHADLPFEETFAGLIFTGKLKLQKFDERACEPEKDWLGFGAILESALVN
ncbi:MAG: glycosyltransferase family 8 protein [Firmicutes bacterium]|nr:glycosyltransferase family 8 protein [Bacillota bacterium]